MLPQLVPAGGAGLRGHLGRVEAALHVPDDVVVNQVHAVAGAFDEDGFPLLDAVQEAVGGDAVVHVAAVQPEVVSPVGALEQVAADQAVDAVVQLDGAGLPAQLHVLPAGAGDFVVLNEHVGGEQPRNAAYPRIADLAAAHHGMTDYLIRNQLMVPALVAHINGHGVAPVDLAVLDDPVVAAIAGDGAALGHGRAGGGVLADQPLHADIA